MKRRLQIRNRMIEYVLKKSWFSLKFKISINSRGIITVTVPRGFNEHLIDTYLITKSDWILEKLMAIELHRKRRSLSSKRQKYVDLKEKARVLAEARLEYFNKTYNFQYGRIAIRDTRSRWGSCSSKRNLNFNYRIALLSPEMADYIIVHELCHLKEMNHSHRFWDLVRVAVPDYRRIKRQLRTMYSDEF